MLNFSPYAVLDLIRYRSTRSSSLHTIAERSTLRPESQTCSPRVNCIETSLFPSLPCLHGKARRCAANRTHASPPKHSHTHLLGGPAEANHTGLLSQGRQTSTDRSSLGSCFEGSQVPPRYITINNFPNVHRSLYPGTSERCDAQ